MAKKSFSSSLTSGFIVTSLVATLVAAAALSVSPAHAQVGPCPGGDDAPSATEVAVTAVPVVVASTTADYFVLYASFDVSGASVEYPVLVAVGEDGTTTLAESVAALPAERYRVEKYSIADPADVDGDCIDDITELRTPKSMNPVNPARNLELSLGSSVLTDQETFEALAYTESSGTAHLKFTILGLDTDRPRVYFQNSTKYRGHPAFFQAISISTYRHVNARGVIVYNPDLVAPDGSRGLYRFRFTGPNYVGPFSLVERAYALLAASMAFVDDDLAVWIRHVTLPESQADLPLFRASRMNLVFDEDIFGETSFLGLNPAEGYGLLRSLDVDDDPDSGDVVIYETLPNELPRVAGIITTVAQTPLSHVNLRAAQDKVPNAFIAGALDDDVISSLIGSQVYYAVTESGYVIRAATQAEVDEHYASSRPQETQTPQRDLSVTSITALSEVGFEDWDSFGVKAANVAVLGSLGFPEGTVPDGFAVPFYFYDEFMKHNGFYDDIEEMLADSDFQTDLDTQKDELKKLRKKIKKAETPEWIETALTTIHSSFPEGTSLRYRSSTNNEDLPGFNGAGLYDSKTQHPDETVEDGISKSLKQVYASLWNYRAFIERDFHRVDHMAAAMGVLVHPNYSDEQVNGVAVSADPAYGTKGSYYVNSQIGEDLVTNPEANSVPEEILLYADGTNTIVALSNQVPAGQLLMTDDQLAQLRRHLATIHERYAQLYAVEDGEQFAMEIEFKITSDNILAIKQARPWIFTDPPEIDDPDNDNADGALTAHFDTAPQTHDGSKFKVRVQFSDNVDIALAVFKDHALEVMGGTATHVRRVNDREDFFEVEVTPDSSLENVTLALAHNRHCGVPGALCTRGWERLSTLLEHTVEGLLPRIPDQPTGAVDSEGTINLLWNDVPRADSYEAQLLRDDQWVNLPTDDIEIAFDGTTAVVSGLPAGGVYSVRVRGVNSHGASGWSPQMLRLSLVLDSEMTVGSDAAVLPPSHGYSMWGDLGGALTSDSFVFEGETYNVQFLAHSRGGLWLGMNRELPADFVLRVGDTVYRGSESLIPTNTTGVGHYWWPSASPDWLEGDSVRVVLGVVVGEASGTREMAPVFGHFKGWPAENDGSEDVSFRVYFTAGVATTADALRDHVLEVSGGVLSSVEAVDRQGRIWEVSVTPDGWVPITVRIEAGLDCDLPEAICSEDGRQLFNPMELTVQAKPNHAPTGTPIINGSPEVGQTLTVDTSSIADDDGLTNATFAYQWIRNDVPIAGATASSYTLTGTDEGKSFKVTVSFSDDDGKNESLTSASVRFDRPFGLAVATSDDAVVLTWQLPAGSPYSRSYFQILRRRPELGETEPLILVEFALVPGATYTDTDVEPGVLYEYRIKGVDPFGHTSEASQPAKIRTPPPPLTAVFLNIPTSHDGQNPFTLQLEFSEQFDVSYRTLRDHAFTVTGGTVTKARRLTRSSNIGWEITIQPDSNADVTILLPTTDNCDVPGALCTVDSKMLFAETTITIEGPGS